MARRSVEPRRPGGPRGLDARDDGAALRSFSACFSDVLSIRDRCSAHESVADLAVVWVESSPAESATEFVDGFEDSAGVAGPDAAAAAAVAVAADPAPPRGAPGRWWWTFL